GLAIGSLLVGRRSEQVRHPLLWYAGIEVAVGLFGLVFHELYLGLSEFAFGTLLPPLAGTMLLTPVRWGLAGALILPPSILLGTTFPLMSAGLIRLRPAEPGRTLAMLYFMNSFGAAIGALVAGFLLIAWVGLPGTLLTAAVLNILVALVAWAVWRRSQDLGITADSPPPPPESTPAMAEVSGWWKLLLGVAFGTAVASFAYEIAWIRMLSLVLGTATHSFELMLSAFILGLAFGSFWVRRRADTFARPVRALAWIQWTMGLLAIATLPLYVRSFGWIEWFVGAMQPSDAGYVIFTVARYGLALLIMLPATFFAGMTLPLITRILMGGPAGERAIGWVYGLNTLGSIVGVGAASLVLMPLLGLKGLLIAGASLDMLLGVFLFSRTGGDAKSRKKVTWSMLGATVVAAGFMLGFVPLDKNLLSSGVYRRDAITTTDQVLFWKDGRTASVSVRQRGDVRFIATNGKIDASVGSQWLVDPEDADAPRAMVADEPTQTFLALVTLAHKPDARVAVVVGQGSGMSSHVLLASPALESLATIEIEPAMIEGSRQYYPGNRRVFDDPRSTLVIDDARSYLSTSDQRFDLILSEPSNPWVSGVSALFTEQFYALVAASLTEEGVFGQWIQGYAIDDDLVLGILTALGRHFPSFSLYRISESAILLVASTGSELSEPDWSVFDLPEVARDLSRTFPFSPAALDRLEFVNSDALRPLLERWPHMNSDFYPILDLGGERAMFLRHAPRGLLAMSEDAFDPSDAYLPPLGTLDPNGLPLPNDGVPMMRVLALTSEFRRARDGEPLSESAAGERSIQRMLRLDRRLRREMAVGERPGDWRAWLDDFLVLDAGVNGGLRGVADEEFRDLVSGFVEVAEAPAGAVAAVRFTQGLRVRDWPTVADATAVLMDEMREGRGWLSPEVVMYGGTTAYLRVGDVAAARALFETLSSALRG
ncbi:MAG: fused MFS/spermidine synthase, partial [Longimicrobiales bacterium]